MLPLRDPECLDTGVSDLPVLPGVTRPYAFFILSRLLSKVDIGCGEDICIARTDSGLRNRGRSLRGVYRVSMAGLPADAGLDEMEPCSEGMAEIIL